MSRVFVTGANGFVGRQLCEALSAHGHEVLGALRRRNSFTAAPNVSYLEIGSISADTDWMHALRNVDHVVHLASRVHVMHDMKAEPLTEYRKVNVEGTLTLAHHAAEAGIGRFVFVSSVKVNGEVTYPDQPYTAGNTPAPVDPYGISKMEAEQGLRKLAEKTGLEVVIVRPPLVYGPGVKANFLKMMRVLARGIPLPLASIKNKRSLVALDNLVDLLATCIAHPAAANKTFMVSDDDDLSTPELLRRMGQALGKPARLIPMPASMLTLGARLLGKQEAAKRLLGSLQIDMALTRALLHWTPPSSVDVALGKTARHFLEQSK